MKNYILQEVALLINITWTLRSKPKEEEERKKKKKKKSPRPRMVNYEKW